MSAVAYLFYKRVSDPLSDLKLEDVPSLWRKEVGERLEVANKGKEEGEENDEDAGGIGQDN